MKLIQESAKYFIAYWFSLTLIPGMMNNTNQLVDFAIASIGFTIIMHAIPYLITFFKFDERNLSTYLLVGSIITVAYTWFLKPGLLGLLYFPQEFSLGEFLDNPGLLSFQFGEFGIIILIGIISLLISEFLNREFK